jgi:hypothetical protein
MTEQELVSRIISMMNRTYRLVVNNVEVRGVALRTLQQEFPGKIKRGYIEYLGFRVSRGKQTKRGAVVGPPGRVVYQEKDNGVSNLQDEQRRVRAVAEEAP